MTDLEKKPAAGSPPRDAAGAAPRSGAPPKRRSIPLPPSSLRPPPRVRPKAAPGREGAGPQAAVLRREGSRGSRRGFVIGLGVPLLGFLIVGALVQSGRRQAERGDGPDVLVRARVDRSEVEPPGAAEAAPSRGEAKATPSRTASPPAAGTGSAGTAPWVSIQVASFHTARRAKAVLADVSARTGLPGIVLPATVNGVTWQRILLGAFRSEDAARTAARLLLQDGTISDVVVRPVPERWLPELTGGASP